VSKIFNRTIMVPAISALVAFGSGYAIADEIPKGMKDLPAKPQAAAQASQTSNPCGTATQAAHQAGMRHGERDMHGTMMEEHQMGAGGSQGMQMGPQAMPMGPGGMQSDCGGKAGCAKGMPKGSNGGSMAPSQGSSPMPMNDM